ncbi:MAG: tetratricopeptide repeat protein [Candidatus Chromulinivorax sp.]
MKYNFIISIFLGIFFSLQSQDNQTLFNKANQLFLEKNYNKAIELYEKISVKNFALFYNLATAYAAEDKFAQALCAIKRAEKLGNWSQLTDLYRFFDCLHKTVNPEYELTFSNQVQLFIKKCILTTPVLLLQILLLLIIGLLFFLWFFNLHRKHLKKYKALLVLAVLFFAVYRYKEYLVQEKIGIVLVQSANVFAGPAASFYVKNRLPIMTEAKIIQSNNDYKQIQVGNMIGWISHQDIIQI